MHPIERLRYVARSGQAPDHLLVAESVPAFSAFADRPGALLVSLRQLISRQPESTALVVLGARMLSSLDPIEAAWNLADELERDAAADLLADELAHRDAEVIDTIATGPSTLVCPPGTSSWIDEARAEGRRVVALTRHGTRLPRLLFEGYLERSQQGAVGAPVELLEPALVDELWGPDGGYRVDAWEADCADLAELASF